MPKAIISSSRNSGHLNSNPNIPAPSDTEARFRDEIASTNLVRMTWLLVTSTALSIAAAAYNLLYLREGHVLWWQLLDVGGSAAFLLLFFLGSQRKLPAAVRWALSPAYFGFWLVVMTGYYFQTLPLYGESMMFVLGIVTPAVLIILPPRFSLALLLPCLAVFWWIHLAFPAVNAALSVEQIFGALMNGSLAVLVGTLAAWYLYSARKTNFQKERLLENRAADLRRAESHMRAILENIPFQAWLKDIDGRFLAVNRLFAEANECSPDAIVGRDATDLYSADRAEQYSREDHAIMEDRRQVHLEQSIEFEDGTVWYEVFKSPVIDDDGQCLGTAGLARDITERRRMEDQLLAANRAKSEFLAAMSHEIRTPMNSVLGYAQLLHDLPLDETQREYVESILGSGRILLAVINDILDFSKIEAGQLALAPAKFAVGPLLERCVRMFEPQAGSKEVSLRIEPCEALPGHLHADPSRIEQILVNLLSNAVKFTDRGSVTLRAREESPGVIRFDVVDTGIGIAPGQLDRLFQPFSQADTSIARRFSGTGLGLVITQRLCELMGGRIAVETAPGRGSTFSAILPIAPAGPDAAHPAEDRGPASLPDLSALRVLVVEDNATNRRLVSAILRRWHIHAALAECGEDALRLCEDAVFDVVLMDVQMPGMDGLETVRKMRAMEAADAERPRSRIVALTGLAMTGDNERCIEAGMDDYLTKPIHTPSLEQALLRARR